MWPRRRRHTKIEKDDDDDVGADVSSECHTPMSGSWEHVEMEEINGVLAIQGSFREHAALVKRAHLNATMVEVRKGSQPPGAED